MGRAIRQSCFCQVQYCLVSAWASIRTACWQLPTLLRGRTGLEGCPPFWYPQFWEAHSYPVTYGFAGDHLFYCPNILEPSVWLSSSAFLPCWTSTAWAEWSQSLHSQHSIPAYPHSVSLAGFTLQSCHSFHRKVFPGWLKRQSLWLIDLRMCRCSWL